MYLLDLRNLQEQVKKHSVSKIVLFELIVNVISKIFANSLFSLEFQRFFSIIT